MTYDCFSFFNELDLLEIRLETLDKVVDKFVLVEASLTHTGHAKPLYFADNRKRFARFDDRIIHVIVNDFPDFNDATPEELAWIRENWQRNAIMRGLPKVANRNDYVIISDVDEIPSPEAIARAITLTGTTRLYQSMFYYFINYKNYTNPVWTIGPQVVPLSNLLSCNNHYTKSARFVDPRVNKGITPTVIRLSQSDNIIKDGGWHFSYCGGVKAIQEKIKAIAHTENNTAENTDYDTINARIAKGTPPFARGDRFFAVPLDKSFPECLRDNPTKYSHLIFQCTWAYKMRAVLPRLYETVKRLSVSVLRLILPRRVKDWLYFHFIDQQH